MIKEIKKGDKKIINAWTFYDWANSSYPLVITTAIFPIFYEKVTSVIINEKVVDETVILFGTRFINTELYSYVVALSFIIVSFSSPLLSGIADYSGNKKRFMQFFCYLGAFSCASLFFFSKDNLMLGMLSILLASVGFWGSLVFYNAFLPEIAEPEDHDKVSAKGFARGYLGSSILLIANLILIKGFDMPAKYSFLTVAVWWVGFAQISFARLPNGERQKHENTNMIFKGLES
jgi:UMF1 family MFS transporter